MLPSSAELEPDTRLPFQPSSTCVNLGDRDTLISQRGQRSLPRSQGEPRGCFPVLAGLARSGLTAVRPVPWERGCGLDSGSGFPSPIPTPGWGPGAVAQRMEVQARAKG